MDIRMIVLVPPALLLGRWLWKTFIAHNPLDNLQGPDSPSFLYGHMKVFISSWPGRKFQTDIVEKYGRVVLLKGPFGSRKLYVSDPRALQVISVREQDVFEEPDYVVAHTKLVFGEGILATLGDQHRKQRKIINPVFNVKHLRELVPVFNDLVNRISGEVKGASGEVELVKWLSRTALELVGVGGLGYSFNALDEDDHEYVKGLKLFGFSSFIMSIFRPVLPYADLLGPAKFRRAIFQSIPSVHTKNILNAADIMWKTTLEIYDLYSSPKGIELEQNFKNTVSEHNIMTILKRANEATNPTERMSEYEMKGQINTLITAANITTSRSLCRIIDLLCQYPDYQERVRAEILAGREKFGGDMTMEQLDTLVLMDAVIRETLRVHPPLPNRARVCNKTTVVPLMYPATGRDGSIITELTIPAGTEVFVGILPPNTDLATWGSDGREWKPERWLTPLPPSVGEAHLPGVFAHQMTFFAGNRACIGFKFAILEIKVVLSALLTHMRFSPGKQEIEFVHAGVYQPTVNKVMVPSQYAGAC